MKSILKNILTIEKKFNVKPYLSRWLTKAPPALKDFLEKENEYLKNNIKPNSNILDVGCGFGRNIKVLVGNAKEIIGIDYDKEVLEVAKKELKEYKNVKLFLEDAKNMHFKDNIFDCVICMGNTFGDMPTIKLQVLNEIKRVTKKGGKIIISVFSKDALDAQTEGLKAAGFKIINIKNGVIYAKQGLATEQFTKSQLKNLFDSIHLRVDVIKLTPISYLCEATKG